MRDTRFASERWCGFLRKGVFQLLLVIASTLFATNAAAQAQPGTDLAPAEESIDFVFGFRSANDESGVADPIARQESSLLTLGIPTASNPMCPEDVTVTATFSIEDTSELAGMNATLSKGEAFAPYYADIVILEDEDPVSGELRFVIPAWETPGRWTLDLLAFATNGEILVTSQSVDLVPGDGDCSLGSLTVGDPVVSGPACPDSVTVTIPYSVNSQEPFDVNASAESDSFPNFAFDQSQESDGQLILHLPPSSESGEWQVEVEAVTSRGQVVVGSATSSFIVESSGECAQGQPSISFGEPQVANQACPEPGIVEIPYRIEAPNGVREVYVSASSNAFPYLVYDRLEVSVGSSLVEGAYSLVLPPTAESGHWTVEFFVTDLALSSSPAENHVTFDVVSNSSCGPTVEVVEVRQSNPVCPEPATLTIDLVFERAVSEVRVVVVAVDPEGIEYESDLYLEAGSPETSDAFSRDGETVTAEVRLPLPANARPGTWRLETDAFVDVIEAFPYVLSQETTFEVEAGPGDCEYEAQPEVTIDELNVSGPVCPDAGELVATVSATNERGIENIAVYAELGFNDFFENEVQFDGAETQQFDVTETLTLPLRASQTPGRYAVYAEVQDKSGRISISDVHYVDVARSSECPTKGPKIAVDDLEVCPSEGTIEATVTATTRAGLSFIEAGGVLLDDPFSEQYFASHLEGQTTYTETFVFTIPPPEERYIYSALEFAAEDDDENLSVFVEYFEIEGRDDCLALDPTPGPTSTPGPSATPTAPSTPGLLATSTPEPFVYWDDGYSPTGFVDTPTAPVTPPEPTGATPTPKKPGAANQPPTKIAFTGSNSSTVGVVGLFVFGVGMVLLGRARRAKKS